MTYELFFIDDESGTITEYHGVLTDEMLIKCTKERYSSQERNKQFRYILNDFSGCTKIDLTTEAVITVAKMAVDVSKINNHIVLAGAMPSDLIFGLGRMWQAYGDETGWNAKALRTRVDAEKWVQETLNQELHFNHK